MRSSTTRGYVVSYRRFSREKRANRRPWRDRRGRLCRGPAEAVLAIGDAQPFYASLAGASTWGLSARTSALAFKSLAVGLAFGAEVRIVVHRPTAPADALEGRGIVSLVEAIPDGFRLDVRLKSPLRPCATPSKPT